MSFTQSAFIRKNTPELIEKLLSLGYKLGNYRPDAPVISACYGEVNAFFNKEPYPYDIDCGENESLFVALAALRDDSDYMQWLVLGKRWMLWKCDCNPHRTQSTTGISSVFLRGHKATVEELIEHFKDEL